MLRFTKMNGAGNDFVLIDNRARDLQLSREQIALVCDRNRGVGADGILMLEPATNGADFRMRYYNADGGEAEMCGNGARCFARFANRVAGAKSVINFETPAGVIGAELIGELVTLQMSDPQDLRMNLQIALPRETVAAHFVNSGVPHVVVPVEKIANVEVKQLGSAIRQHEMFSPAGANVNFMEIRAEDEIAIRTYERGVEDETLACGTGVVASALIHAATSGAKSPITISVRGGSDLQVGFERAAANFRGVTLTGPAEFVFEGSIEV